MCLAVPVKIVEVNGDKGMAELSGTRREVGLQLLDDVKKGDYVLLHAGFAIQKLDREEAKKTLDLWEEMIAAGSEDRKDSTRR